MANISLNDKSGTPYTTTDLSLVCVSAIALGCAIVKCNTATEPTVSISGGVATKIAGAKWLPSTDMYCNISSFDGVNVEYFWTNVNNGFSFPQRLEENATVTGFKNIDWNAFETFRLTLTGATTFANVNLPSSGSKVITMRVTGNFALTFPANWTATFVNGAYDGTKTNLIVVEYVAAATSYINLQISQPS